MNIDRTFEKLPQYKLVSIKAGLVFEMSWFFFSQRANNILFSAVKSMSELCIVEEDRDKLLRDHV